MNRGLVLSACLLLAACANTGAWRQGAPEVERCIDDYAAIEKAVQQAGVADAEFARIAGFPYFRIDRFLESYDFKSFEAAERTAWIDRLVARALDGQRIEIGNLPQGDRQSVEARLGGDAWDRVETCAKTVRTFDHKQKAAHRALPPAARVEDHYSSGLRLLGLYPLTAPVVNFGFGQWKADNLPILKEPLDNVPVEGRIATYAPPESASLSPAEVKGLVDSSRTNALSIPEPEGETARALIAAFAPVWQVDVTSPDDFIGTPRWKDGRVEINAGQPVTYARFSHVHWQGEVLLQISYMVWFPARTVQGSFDFLGGHIDGLTWRVTIGPDGRPLLYDTMHNCGCYHLFFPTEGLRARPSAERSIYNEGETIAAPAPHLALGERVAIRLATVSHYVVHVDPWQGDADTSYGFADYHDLRQLPRPGGGTRSMFGPTGIVPGTERRERFWLWTMGIESPGAMRQWGTHATVFVGRRHFDDPWLIEKTFEPSGTGGRE